ncbi:MAG: NAD(P)/FAD-dependent oxidoreductase, partial [Verrucomicrobiae bacterium]|nr:NAD(P)/FAD-dependent oxidoreductase [Verrucomicrobiae bacterium]NNJ86845.1 NAD(P)/FAD-dependent oxidoreductase [Akkermansiaceae bacterium]
MQTMENGTKQMDSNLTPGPVAETVDRSTDYDVVVLGGAFSGSSSAILLKRRFPELKILIVEKSEEFDRKVGESTSEVSGCFLTKVLKVGNHLSRQHVGKHGLRMWFHKETDDMPGDSTEVGPAFQGRLPTFQLNRITLDTHLLEEAAKLGCEIVRPANIKNIDLGGIGKNTVSYKTPDSETHEITAGWVVDASGKAALLARKLGTLKKNTEAHPVSSMWTRFKNVCDLDSNEAAMNMPNRCACVKAQRSFSTNHLMGFGWW